MGNKEQKIEMILDRAKRMTEYERNVFDYALICIERAGKEDSADYEKYFSASK